MVSRFGLFFLSCAVFVFTRRLSTCFSILWYNIKTQEADPKCEDGVGGQNSVLVTKQKCFIRVSLLSCFRLTVRWRSVRRTTARIVTGMNYGTADSVHRIRNLTVQLVVTHLFFGLSCHRQLASNKDIIDRRHACPPNNYKCLIEEPKQAKETTK